MTLWSWLTKKFCAHEWETLAELQDNIVRRTDKSVIGKYSSFHERCKVCGANNMRTFKRWL